MTGETTDPGTVSKLTTLADGGWRVTIDFPDGEPPPVRNRDAVVIVKLDVEVG